MDYRSFLPAAIEDANRNIQEARYDALGQVLVTSFHGTELGLPVGFDRLETYVAPPDRHPAIAIADPKKPSAISPVSASAILSVGWGASHAPHRPPQNG